MNVDAFFLPLRGGGFDLKLLQRKVKLQVFEITITLMFYEFNTWTLTQRNKDNLNKYEHLKIKQRRVMHEEELASNHRTLFITGLNR